MKKLLLSLSTMTLLTAPLVSVVACGAVESASEGQIPDATPDDGADDDADGGGNTDSGGDTGSGGDTDSGGDTGSGGDTDSGGDTGSGGDSGTEGDAGTEDSTIRPIMNEVEIESYLQDRSFVILGDSGTSMGSGWLMDESEDNWYIGTNRHVTEALDNGNGEVYISNDWDRMWQDYNIRDYTYTFHDNGTADVVNSESVVNPMTDGELDWLFKDLRTTGQVGEIIYETVDPNAGNTGGTTAIDYYDFGVIKLPKLGSIVEPTTDPIEVATFDYVKEQYSYYYESKYFFRGYSFASGNYRFGSFFNNTYVNGYNSYQAKAWSPSIAYDPPGSESYSNWGFDNGPGSSGSAMIDERGYFVANNTFGYSDVYPYNKGNAEGLGKFHHSGVSGQGFWDTIYPAYIQTLQEPTELYPTWS